MEGKSNFSRRLKLVWWLDLTDPDPQILRQIYATAGKELDICDVDAAVIVALINFVMCRSTSVYAKSTLLYAVYYDSAKNNAVLYRLCSCFQLGPRAAVTQHRALLRSAASTMLTHRPARSWPGEWERERERERERENSIVCMTPPCSNNARCFSPRELSLRVYDKCTCKF